MRARVTPEKLGTAEGAEFEIGDRFAEAFALRLRLFQSLHSLAEHMTKKAFEYAFAFAANASGHQATLDPSATTAASDIVVGGVGVIPGVGLGTGVSVGEGVGVGLGVPVGLAVGEGGGAAPPAISCAIL